MFIFFFQMKNNKYFVFVAPLTVLLHEHAKVVNASHYIPCPKASELICTCAQLFLL